MFSRIAWQAFDAIVEFCHWPCVCTKGLLPQTAGSNRNNPLSWDVRRPRLRCHPIFCESVFVAHRHSVLILDCWMDLTLAMTYTRSLTDNRASLLTILMFSTGFLVCSCTVLYTVANTFVSRSFPVVSDDTDPRVDATCVSAEAVKVSGVGRDSVRKHTVALTKKKQCCTDQYIWWSLCVYSIHL